MKPKNIFKKFNSKIFVKNFCCINIDINKEGILKSVELKRSISLNLYFL